MKFLKSDTREEEVTSIKLFFKYWYLTFISFLILFFYSLFIIVGIKMFGGYNFNGFNLIDYFNLFFGHIWTGIWILAISQIPLYIVYIFIQDRYNKKVRNKFIKTINILYVLIIVCEFIIFHVLMWFLSSKA